MCISVKRLVVGALTYSKWHGTATALYTDQRLVKVLQFVVNAVTMYFKYLFLILSLTHVYTWSHTHALYLSFFQALVV
jgi:hypothetical protein